MIIGGVIAIATLSCCFGVPIAFISIGGAFFSGFGNVVTHEDYPTNKERIEYLENMLSVSFPEGTQVVRFHLEGFQDYQCEAVLIVPVNSMAEFLDGFPNLDNPQPGILEGSVGADYLSIQFNEETGEVIIEYVDT